jgi:hypothetical protein
MIRQLIFIICTFFIITSVTAQEAITGLQVNQRIKQALSEGSKPLTKSGVQLTLPFFDDFSDAGVYPSYERWTNNDVFVNYDYPVFPITAGVVTFDAIDENGELYPDAGDNRFRADHLTTHPIRLDSVFSPEPRALGPADSLYLSFYFQPEGLGFAPNEGDSLVLEFYHDHPVDSLKRWNKVWSSTGMTLNEFFSTHNAYFKRVMIPVTDTAYFKPGFRFRFYNIASIRFPNAPSHQSNRDHWHVDYVYLNFNRNINDIYYPDIAFAQHPGSFLKNYHAMPYLQYKQNFVNEMRDSLRVRATNLHNSTTSGSYRYIVRRPDGSNLDTYESGNFAFQPFSQSGYVSEAAIARPPVIFAFPVNVAGTPVSFRIQHVLRNQGGFSPNNNDTLEYQQVFSDYYAYDDGTAEAGYGLTYTGGMIAYKFKLNTPDTLTSLSVFFNRTLGNANQKYFHMKVWNNEGGKPGQMIYEERFLRVEYGNNLNGFYNYQLEEHVFIDNARFPGLSFFVGIEQTTADLLNIGFDRNNNNQQNIFYSCGDDWCNTMYDGSLMMRPVFGTSGVSGIGSGLAVSAKIHVYPNPVSNGVLNLQMKVEWLANSHFQIINLTGMKLLEGKTSASINVSGLPPGIYLLRIINGEQTGHARFVVHR